MKLALFWCVLSFVCGANVVFAFQFVRFGLHRTQSVCSLKHGNHVKSKSNVQHLSTYTSQITSLEAIKSTFVGYDVYQDSSTDNFATKLTDMKYAPFTKIFRHQMTWIILICLIRDGYKRLSTYFRRNILKQNTFPEVNNPLFEARRKEAEYEALGLETFECDKCGNQFKPATGRAKAIMSRPNFHCTRCKSKADRFFNIDNLKDPRAVKRWERLNKEEEEREAREAEYYESGGNEEVTEEGKESDNEEKTKQDSNGDDDTDDNGPHYADDYDRGYTD